MQHVKINHIHLFSTGENKQKIPTWLYMLPTESFASMQEFKKWIMSMFLISSHNKASSQLVATVQEEVVIKPEWGRGLRMGIQLTWTKGHSCLLFLILFLHQVQHGYWPDEMQNPDRGHII